MEQKILVDTNVIIDYFGNRLTDSAYHFVNNNKNCISLITKIEVLGWYAAPQNDILRLSEFLSFFELLLINDEIVETCINLRQQKKIKLGDAIIASTALVYNLTLLTRNITDFKKIPNLHTIDPYLL